VYMVLDVVLRLREVWNVLMLHRLMYTEVM
jgi:hypothetical protein